MATTTPTDAALTREQLKTIRNADSAVLRWNHKETDKPDVLELVKEIKEPNGFGSYDLRVQLPCPARVANYGGDRYPEDADSDRLDRAVSGDWVLLYIRHHDEWNTFAHFLKPGDRLEQEWTVDNRNELLKKARLTHHEVKIRIRRTVTLKGVERERVYTFMLDSAVQNPYNLADNVRREPRS